MARGVKARYTMPRLNALPGFSPICWVVRVQMEHCARAWKGSRPRQNINGMINFFIIAGKPKKRSQAEGALQKYINYIQKRAFAFRQKLYCISLENATRFGGQASGKKRLIRLLLFSAFSEISCGYLHPESFCEAGFF
jgi:hypothetical protein